MMTLRDIVGHEQPLTILRRGLAEGRLHHSLLFHGPDAVGKRTVALALAATLNCVGSASPRPGGPDAEDACGTCPSCIKVDKGLHPDVRYITLEKTVIPIDAIRKLREEAAYHPYEGKRRVFIVDPAEGLSIDAQNALLKTLEEPSASSCLTLITSRPHQLLPTTRSRCQMIAFGTLPARTLARRLEESHGMTGPDATKAAKLSGGRYGAALTLDLAQHDAVRDELLAVLTRLTEDIPRRHVLTDIEVFGEQPAEMATRLALLGALLRDMMVIASGAASDALVHADRAEQLTDLAQCFAAGLDGMIDRVRLAASDLERNVNRKVLAETLLFDLAARRATA